MSEIKIGIIGGSGFYALEGLQDGVETSVDTPFGAPSDKLIQGTIGSVKVVVLARHGRNHSVNPTNVNYRANIAAFKQLGVTHILAATACGSLKEEFAPGDFVILDSFIDRTTKRQQTFHDGKSFGYGSVCHVPMSPSFCPDLRGILTEVARGKKDYVVHDKGTMVTIEGPRFSSKAESLAFRAWGADVINMTTVPEVVLAKEAGISYVSVAMVTDYDCWRESEEAVDVAKVLAVLKDNAGKVKNLFLDAIPVIAGKDWRQIIENNSQVAKGSIMH